ncbi:MAG: SLATT domain-containing protein [Rhodospirillaceae bacterium]|jgi:hypothetical protein|nr:SLATT domain-containing protein [Rhodospirillaceae bacterium]
MMTTSLDPNRRLLAHWRRNCLRSAIGNYDAASKYKQMNYRLGMPAIVLSTIVGTSVFAALSEEVNSATSFQVFGGNISFQLIQVGVGVMSVLAAALGALQTFFKWGELSSKHQSAAAEYNAAKRYIDQLLARQEGGKGVKDSEINYVRQQMDTLSRDTPELPASIWKSARNQVPTVSTGSAENKT